MPFPKSLSLDFETFSECNLKTSGLDNYAKHSSTEILMLAWAYDNDAPQLWVPAVDGPMPPRLRNGLQRREIVKRAWNAQFERVIFREVLKIDIPYDQWQCTMVNAFMLALPGDLDSCGKVLGLDADRQKLAAGKALIRLFCMPQKLRGRSEKAKQAFAEKHELVNGVWRATAKTHPAEWATFCSYCRRDVVAERTIHRMICKYPVPDFMRQMYALDQKINDAGLPLDLTFIHNALGMVKKHKLTLARRMRELSGVKNPNSGAQILPWLRENGYPFSSLKKDRVELALKDFKASMTPSAVALLRMRLPFAKSSATKLAKMLQLVGPDGVLRYQFQMSGAGRTSRFAGRGVQPHNFPRPDRAFKKHLAEIRQMIVENDYDSLYAYFDDVVGAVSSSIRSAIAAPPGYEFVVSDLSSIETVVSAEVANAETVRQVFRQGKDVYRDFGVSVLHKPYEEITSDERQFMKPAVLGGFYRLGGGAVVGNYPDVVKTGLLGYAASMNVELGVNEAATHIRIFREKYHEVPVSWAEIETAVMETVRTGKPTRVNILEFDIMKPFLRMKLPSGRYVYYLRPKLLQNTVSPPGKKPFTKIALSYEGYNKAKQWTRIFTHSGKLFENAVQAIAFDVLALGMLRADARGFVIRGHVHDEQVTLRKEGDERYGVPALEAVMKEKMPWLPHMHLGAEGYAGKFYKKG